MGRWATPILALTAVLAATGCGGSTRKATPPATRAASTAATTTPPPTTTRSPATTTTGTPPPLQGEAASAAAGDIPDNQVFLAFRNGAAGYSMKYPEGWAQQGSGRSVVFRDKNNIVRIVIANGPPPTAANVSRRLEKATVTTAPARLTISGAPVIKVVYRTESATNPVTGKRVNLTVDRYYLHSGHRTAIVDLGTPVGVDNVDAYRLMIESFRWR